MSANRTNLQADVCRMMEGNVQRGAVGNGTMRSRFGVGMKAESMVVSSIKDTKYRKKSMWTVPWITKSNCDG